MSNIIPGYIPPRPRDRRIPAGRKRAEWEAARVRKISPKARLAARLYASGVCNKTRAARAAGIQAAWFTNLTNYNDETKHLLDDVDKAIMDQGVDMGTTLRTLGREGIHRIRELMHSPKDEVALKAATDLADRSPETSKIHRHQLLPPQLSEGDAKELARALVEAAQVRRDNREIVAGDFVRVIDLGANNGEGQPTHKHGGTGEAQDGDKEASRTEAQGSDSSHGESQPSSSGVLTNG